MLRLAIAFMWQIQAISQEVGWFPRLTKAESNKEVNRGDYVNELPILLAEIVLQFTAGNERICLCQYPSSKHGSS